jgi:acetyl esterase/lipase
MTQKRSVKKIITSALMGVAVTVSNACSPVKVLNGLVPSDGYYRYADIAYGALPRQRLDIYQPKHVNAASAVAIFFYGGSWDSGSKNDYKFVAEALTSQGITVVIPDYRVYPDVLFPEFMNDPVHVAQWVKHNILQYGGDPQRVFLSGHSAGAHIAVMLGVNAEYLTQINMKPADFRGIIGLAGPYDFLPLQSNRLKAIFGEESQQWKSQPIHFVDGRNPPMQLLVGLKDDTVWPRNTFNFAAKIQQAGGQVEVVEFPSYQHVDMAAKLAKPLRGDGSLLKYIVGFIQRRQD